MKAELKQRWVRALRSRKYKQGRGALRKKTPDGFTYCCMGVLADLIAPDSWENPEPNGKCHSNWANDMEEFDLDRLREIGLDPMEQCDLIAMNDGEESKPVGFRRIADWIEKNVLDEEAPVG